MEHDTVIKTEESFFFQNEEIFIQLDELDELDRIAYAWNGFNSCLTQAQNILV